jgi:hypothetical protein
LYILIILYIRYFVNFYKGYTLGEMSLIAEEDRVPELGDRITITSKEYGRITGRILYRDETLVRVKPQVSATTSRRIYDFPIDPATGEFQESVGVEQIQFHAKRTSPWFSKQLAILPDSDLLLYSSDPTPERVHVLTIISTDDEDAIVIRREGKEESERIDFAFLGPPPPLLFLEPVVTEGPPELVPEEETVELPELEAAGAVVEIARIDQSYPDREQEEDMGISLLSEYPLELHTNQRLLTILQQQAATFLSLKQSIMKQSYDATTLLEAIQMTEEPLEAILPVATIRRSLYLEDTNQETELYQVQNELENFGKMLTAATSGFDTSTDARGNRFAKYIGSILSTGSGTTQGTLSTPYIAKRVTVVQEVFRAPTGARTRGLVSDLPAGHRIYGKSFKADTKLKQRYIGDVSHHLYRMVGETVMKHPETGQVIQLTKADVIDPLQYLLLPPSIAQQRCTITRCGALLWDVQKSETIRSLSQLSSRITDSAQVYEIDSTMNIADIVQNRITVPFYKPSDVTIQSILDGIGLRTLEWTPEIYEVVLESMNGYQTVWNHSFEEAKKRTTTLTPTVPILSSAVESSSLLLTSIDSTPLLQEISNAAKAKETTLKELDLVVAGSLLAATSQTRVPLWYGVAAGHPEELKEFLDQQTRIVESEVARLSTIKNLAIEKEKSYHAEPIINSCEHVKELELIRGVEIEEDRMKLLDLFHQKYESSTKGNWIQCSVCHKDLICRHEILMLQEYKQKTNTKIFQKILRIEFITLQQDGNYVCKNCGIPISEIEYDTNPEFDDEGKLMQGYSILTDEPLHFSLENFDLVTAIQDTEIKESKMTEDKLNIYHVIRDLFENAGANPSDAIYKRCVNAIYNQLLILDNPYKERILSKLKARTPDESVIVATLLVILSTAFVIAELQISENELPIYITRQGCAFSRDGFPRDKEGTGLLEYMVCIILQIDLDTFPWTTTLWAGLNGESRKKLIIQEVKYALIEVAKNPTITDALQTALLKREKEGTFVGSVPVFRSRVGAPPAITNKEGFQRSVMKDPIQSIRREVIGRTEALSQEIIQTAHQLAIQTKEDLPGQSVRLDGQCGRLKIADLGPYGFGIVGLLSEAAQQEVQLLRAATPLLLQRDPSHSLGMSHFITPWSAKIHSAPAEQDIESLSFRLFLKACATGPTAGLPHEYGMDRMCRRCGVRFPIEILNLTVEEEYTSMLEATEKPGKKLDEVREKLQEIMNQKDEISKQVLEEADVHVDHEAFLTLQDRIHLNRKIEPIESTPILPWIDQITLLVRDIPSLYENWNLFITFFTTTSEKDRIARFVPVSNLITFYIRQITNRFLTLAGKANQKNAQSMINAFTTHLETIITSKTKAVTTLITLFVSSLKRIANGIESSIKGSKWFRGITFQHEELLQEIWKKYYKIVDTAIEELDNHENETYKKIVYTVLNRYTNLIGNLLEIIIHFVRISPMIHETEFKDLLRWITLGSISLLLDETSVLYNTENIVLRQSAAYFIGKNIFQLFELIHIQLHHVNKTPEQIKDAIESRKQQERERFIKKQDKLASDAEKRADNLMKLFGLGDYSEGALKNKFTYDADFYEFHRNQRLEYGLPEFSEDIMNREASLTDASPVEEGGTFDEYIGANEQDE